MVSLISRWHLVFSSAICKRKSCPLITVGYLYNVKLSLVFDLDIEAKTEQEAIDKAKVKADEEIAFNVRESGDEWYYDVEHIKEYPKNSYSYKLRHLS